MKRSLLALALAAALPVSAQAAELSYNFIELDYARMNVDDDGGFDVDPDGFGLKGSFELGEKMYAFGSYLRGSDEIAGFDFDIDQTQLGLGDRHGISDTADFIAELRWMNVSADVDGFDADANGGRVSAGFRGVMAENFEGYAKANYTDGGDFDGEFSGTLGAQVKFNPTWGITGEAEFGSDTSIYMLGLRASF